MYRKVTKKNLFIYFDIYIYNYRDIIQYKIDRFSDVNFFFFYHNLLFHICICFIFLVMHLLASLHTLIENYF